MRLYLDSSTLAKRYIEEPGTDRVLHFCRKAEDVVLSFISLPEIVSAFNRLRREKKISHSDYLDLKSELAADVEQAGVVEFSPSVLQKTIYCLEQSPLRTLDAIHLACALESSCDLFLTADRRQADAARALKMKVAWVGS